MNKAIVKRAVFLLAAFLAASCGAFRGDRPNVLLVTFDTLRADHLHCYGYERIDTPVIDDLAARGMLFENAYTTVPLTLPAHTSILTGLYPNQHGIRANGIYRLAEETVTIAELLGEAGYETAAFVSAHVLDRSYRIDQGFSIYDDEMEDALVASNPLGPGSKVPEYTKRWVATWTQPYQRKAESVVGRAIDWLRDRGEKADPFFCWVHFFDPHTSYAPPEPWSDRYGESYEGEVDGTAETFEKISESASPDDYRRHFDRMVALYDGEISYADQWLGRLLEEIPDNTLVVFLSDHGEAFGEHGQIFEHGAGIFDETVRVPFILTGPGIETGTRRTDVASVVDVVPTILDYVDLDPKLGLPGRTLLGTPDAGDARAVYCETMCSRTAVPTPVCFKGVRTDEWSLLFRINKRSQEVMKTLLYHLSRDPAEKNDVLAENRTVFLKLKEQYREFRDLDRDDEKNPANFWDLSEKDERFDQLKALGYID